jgi:putative FmdB family regulatory protein
MPTHDQECQACGYRFEGFQSISSKPPKTCPTCAGSARHLPGAVAIAIFKKAPPSTAPRGLWEGELRDVCRA